jgi:hypothetical protein
LPCEKVAAVDDAVAVKVPRCRGNGMLPLVGVEVDAD